MLWLGGYRYQILCSVKYPHFIILLDYSCNECSSVKLIRFWYADSQVWKPASRRLKLSAVPSKFLPVQPHDRNYSSRMQAAQERNKHESGSHSQGMYHLKTCAITSDIIIWCFAHLCPLLYTWTYYEQSVIFSAAENTLTVVLWPWICISPVVTKVDYFVQEWLSRPNKRLSMTPFRMKTTQK